MKAIDVDNAEALEVVGFQIKDSALTAYNHFKRDKDKTGTFFNFVLVL